MSDCSEAPVRKEEQCSEGDSTGGKLFKVLLQYFPHRVVSLEPGMKLHSFLSRRSKSLLHLSILRCVGKNDGWRSPPQLLYPTRSPQGF